MNFLMNMFKNNKYTNINANELKILIKENKNYIIIDVRTNGEYKSGHIDKAKNIPVNELKNKIKSIDKFKDKISIIYCASGARSKTAANILYKEGFENIYNLKGGIYSYINTR